MAKELKIYFTNNEEPLHNWFTKTYPTNKSRIIKKHIEELKKAEYENSENQSATEILARHLSDILPNEDAWITRMLCIMAKTELTKTIKNRISFIMQKHPDKQEELRNILNQTYPKLAKMV